MAQPDVDAVYVAGGTPSPGATRRGWPSPLRLVG
jgi:hypothetical protein